MTRFSRSDPARIALVLVAALWLGGCSEQREPMVPAPEETPTFAQADNDSFPLRAYGADTVHWAGSTNGWNSNDPSYEFTALGDGYSWGFVTDLPAGLQFYKFVLRNAGPGETWLTDPAAWEISPDGIHGDPAYWNGVRGRSVITPQELPTPPQRERLVIYEIGINDFSGPGTFASVVANLTSGPDLVDLGVNAIELLPVTVPSYNGWGYDPVLYFAPNPSFGWPSTFATLVDAAHAHGIAVLLDMVLNHCAGSSALRQLDTFAGTYNFTTTEANPWGLVELNWSNQALRDHILDALCHWVDRYKVDGFRFDYIAGESYATWIWLKDQLRARYPDLLLIAEDYNYPSNSITYGYDAQWGGNHTDGWGGGGNNFNQVMITCLTERGFAWRGETVPTVGAWGTAYRNMWAAANVLSGNSSYAGPAPGDGFSDVKFLESHDENRVVWSVNTIGSAGAQAIGGLQKAHLGAIALMTGVGIPMLWNGQEIGSGEYRPASPTIYKIDWNGGDQNLRSIYKNLIRLRLLHPALVTEHIFFPWRDGIIDQEERTMVYWRSPTGNQNDASLVVALNFDHNDHAWTIPFPADGSWYRFYPANGAHEHVAISGGGLALTVTASTGIIWVKDDGVTAVP
jgi:1,4-alpha-glucan branching enzyme